MGMDKDVCSWSLRCMEYGVLVWLQGTGELTCAGAGAVALVKRGSAGWAGLGWCNDIGEDWE